MENNDLYLYKDPRTKTWKAGHKLPAGEEETTGVKTKTRRTENDERLCAFPAVCRVCRRREKVQSGLPVLLPRGERGSRSRLSEVTFQQWKYGQMSFPAWAAAKLGRELNFDVSRVDWPRKRSANAGGQS